MNTPAHKYWAQEQAPAGNYIDSLGTNDLKGAKQYADFLKEKLGYNARVVERTDKVIYSTGK